MMNALSWKNMWNNVLENNFGEETERSCLSIKNFEEPHEGRRNLSFLIFESKFYFKFMSWFSDS